MRTPIFLYFFLFAFAEAFSAPISGYVFFDKNNNGIHDKNEVGIKDVTVSDQITVVKTNAEGFYQLQGWVKVRGCFGVNGYYISSGLCIGLNEFIHRLNH